MSDFTIYIYLSTQYLPDASHQLQYPPIQPDVDVYKYIFFHQNCTIKRCRNTYRFTIGVNGNSFLIIIHLYTVSPHKYVSLQNSSSIIVLRQEFYTWYHLKVRKSFWMANTFCYLPPVNISHICQMKKKE